MDQTGSRMILGVPSPFFPGLPSFQETIKNPGKQRFGFQKNDGCKEWLESTPRMIPGQTN